MDHLRRHLGRVLESCDRGALCCCGASLVLLNHVEGFIHGHTRLATSLVGDFVIELYRIFVQILLSHVRIILENLVRTVLLVEKAYYRLLIVDSLGVTFAV